MDITQSKSAYNSQQQCKSCWSLKHTQYLPRNYAHELRLAVFWSGMISAIWSISVKITSLALGQSHDYPRASEATMEDTNHLNPQTRIMRPVHCKPEGGSHGIYHILIPWLTYKRKNIHTRPAVCILRFVTTINPKGLHLEWFNYMVTMFIT